jgi:hypothetical protein
MFGRRGPDSELERRLRAERPQAPDELVDRLAVQMAPVRGPRRATGPRLALIGVATAAIVLSLGVAGAFGSASGSIQAFSRGVFHIVQPPHVLQPPAQTPNTPAVNTNHNGNQGPPLGFLDPRFWSHRQFGPPAPFMHQYAGRIPICWHGQIIYVTPFEYLWYFVHGGLPARDCVIHHP